MGGCLVLDRRISDGAEEVRVLLPVHAALAHPVGLAAVLLDRGFARLRLLDDCLIVFLCEAGFLPLLASRLILHLHVPIPDCAGQVFFGDAGGKEDGIQARGE